MAESQVNIAIRGGNVEALRQRLQDTVDANRIAMNLRQQQQLTTAKARVSSA